MPATVRSADVLRLFGITRRDQGISCVNVYVDAVAPAVNGCTVLSQREHHCGGVHLVRRAVERSVRLLAGAVRVARGDAISLHGTGWFTIAAHPESSKAAERTTLVGYEHGVRRANRAVALRDRGRIGASRKVCVTAVLNAGKFALAGKSCGLDQEERIHGFVKSEKV